MKLTLFTIAAFVSGVLSQDIHPNTPSNVLQCTPIQISWTGGTGPFTLTVQTPDANGQNIETYTGVQGSPFVWNANVGGGVQYGITLHDSQGETGQTGPFVVTAGDSSCLNATQTVFSGSGSGSSTPAPATSDSSSGSSGSLTSSAPSGSTTGSATSGSSTGSPSSHSSSGTGPSGTSSSGAPAPSNTSSAGFVNKVSTGFAAAALLAIGAIMA